MEKIHNSEKTKFSYLAGDNAGHDEAGTVAEGQVLGQHQGLMNEI